jgi:hypothetical protein
MLTLLSLDSVAPFYEAMGLGVPDKRRFQELLRGVITEHRDVAGPDAPLRPASAEEFLRRLESAFGGQAAERFRAWAETVFFSAHEDLPQWSAWDIILPHHADDVPEGLGLPPERLAAVESFRQSFSVRDLEGQVTDARGVPLSEWDAEVYALYRFSKAEDPMFEDDFTDPFGFVLGTARMNRFQENWARHWQHYTPAEKEAFRAYGQQMLDDEEIYMPEPLSHPDQLVRKL